MRKYSQHRRYYANGAGLELPVSPATLAVLASATSALLGHRTLALAFGWLVIGMLIGRAVSAGVEEMLDAWSIALSATLRATITILALGAWAMLGIWGLL